MKLYISRNALTYIVKAEMPGVSKDRIGVLIDGNEITITGEVAKGWRVGQVETRKMSRSFVLPQEIDETKADVTYEDGMLRLMLPWRRKSLKTAS